LQKLQKHFQMFSRNDEKDEIVFLKLYFMHYFYNFETKFFKLFATALIANGRRATVGQPRSLLVAVGCKSDNNLAPLNFSDKKLKITIFKFQILSLFFIILCHFEFILRFYDTYEESLIENDISWS